MTVFLLLLMSVPALSGAVSSGASGGRLVLDFPRVETQVLGDYRGMAVPGCGTMEEAVLPVRIVRIPVEPGSTPGVRVEAIGIGSLGPASGIASSYFTAEGVEAFREADASEFPTGWGRVVEYGTWRRAGYVQVALYPVIHSGGELLHASGIRVELDGGLFSHSRASGHQGLLYSLFFGSSGGCVTVPPRRLGTSPFWGRPWARVRVDTSGVFQVTGEMIPGAVGMPSSSFSMYCGRGRNMDEESPWEDSFEPRPVPLLVEDGGDGVFDESDRVLFFGRGLSWWDEGTGFEGQHYNGGYDSLNTYWLTWGGSGGPFMDQQDCSLTGAPSAGGSHTGRQHFEKNFIRTNAVRDMWSWGRISGSHTQTANVPFNSPGATGEGLLRAGLSVGEAPVFCRATLNGEVLGDTLLSVGANHVVSFGTLALKASGNNLALRFTAVSGSYTVNLDWVSVYPVKSFSSSGTSMEVPLLWNVPPGQRRRIDWAQNLDPARAFLVNEDTLAIALSLPSGNAFEVQVPHGWRMPLMFMYPSGVLPEPFSVEPASPGRIRGTLSGADVIVVHPDQFTPDMPLLDRPDGRIREFVSLGEIWDEFNGGVRDPQAVRAFMDWVLTSWDPLPSDLVLVGSGHFDPRHFLYAQPCPMDVIIVSLIDEGVSDDRYGVVSGSSQPQFAVSRVYAGSRSELQFLAQRSWDYFAMGSSGEWQSEVIAAADDERYVRLGQSYYTDTYHTAQTETILEAVPGRFFVDRQYGIFHVWNDAGKKPSWRQSFIEAWSRGALAVLFMGHGSYDQIADEGLFYLEDAALLSNGHRLPYAFFGSCDVGMFQFPGRKCISGEVTLAQGGGAIAALGATVKTQGGSNRDMLKSIFDQLFNGALSMGEATWMGKVLHGGSFNRYYIFFGDGSLRPALPDSGLTHGNPILRTGERATLSGSLEGREGLVMVSAWESMEPDTYFTYQTSLPIPHLSVPGLFHRGSVQASPQFTQDVFVPLVAATGQLARVRFFSPGPGGGSLSCLFPGILEPGTPSGDSEGPEMELWIQGYRGTPIPRVSGEVWFSAEISDSSGINLLPYPGAQLALYVDGVPSDVSEYFVFDQGSSQRGRLLVPLQSPAPGMHHLRLRATDGLMNISWAEMEFEMLSGGGPVLGRVWVYPNPSSSVAGFHWDQTGPGPVDIAVYTVTGRPVASFRNLQGSPGYNQSVWDLLDADGDPVASGAYLYTVTAGDSSVSGVMAVVRD